ncbi:MAG: hypothetical protein H6Q00_3546 [Holophagaceae bacterium]|nr:hypothetical protein [Holophagaceae bacterium]
MEGEKASSPQAVWERCFPRNPRRPPVPRPVQVAIRTLHIVAMGMLIGALPYGGTAESLRLWILATLLSGCLLLAIDLWKTGMFLVEGAGAGVILKLVLLGLGNLYPESRLGWYLAAAAVASFGSHMPSGWRHFSFLEWRVMEIKGKGKD